MSRLPGSSSATVKAAGTSVASGGCPVNGYSRTPKNALPTRPPTASTTPATMTPHRLCHKPNAAKPAAPTMTPTMKSPMKMPFGLRMYGLSPESTPEPKRTPRGGSTGCWGTWPACGTARPDAAFSTHLPTTASFTGRTASEGTSPCGEQFCHGPYLGNTSLYTPGEPGPCRMTVSRICRDWGLASRAFCHSGLLGTFSCWKSYRVKYLGCPLTAT